MHARPHPAEWWTNLSCNFTNCRFWLILIFPICFFDSRGQFPETSAQWVKLDKVVKSSTSWVKILDDDGRGGFFVFKERFQSSTQKDIPYLLEHYDNDFNLKGSCDLQITFGKKRRTAEQVFFLNGKLYAAASRIQGKKIQVYASEIDRNTMMPSDNKILISEIELLKKPVKTSFFITLAADKSKVFVLLNPYQDDTGGGIYAYTMLDDHLEKIWQKKIALPKSTNRMSVEDIKVSNDGNVYVLTLIRGFHDLFIARNDGDSLSRFPIRLNNWSLPSVLIELREKNDLLIAGFYSKAGAQETHGIYFQNVDFDAASVKSKSHAEFEAKFILQDLSRLEMNRTLEMSEKNVGPALFRYTLDKILIDKGGSIILLGEQQYGYTNATRDYISRPNQFYFLPQARNRTNIGPTASTYYGPTPKNDHFVFNDIVALKLDSSREHIEWSRKISKAQDTMYDKGIYSSYFSALVGGKICLLFNDNPKNINPNQLQKMRRPKEFSSSNAILAVVSLDGAGNETKQWIYNSVDMDVTMIPKSGCVLSSGELVLFGRRAELQQLGRVRLK